MKIRENVENVSDFGGTAKKVVKLKRRNDSSFQNQSAFFDSLMTAPNFSFSH